MPYLYLHGPMTTGKTSITKALITTMGIVHAFIDCSSTYSSSLLLSDILGQLLQYFPPSFAEGTRYTILLFFTHPVATEMRKRSTPHSFLTALSYLCKQPLFQDRTVVLVLLPRHKERSSPPTTPLRS